MSRPILAQLIMVKARRAYYRPVMQLNGGSASRLSNRLLLWRALVVSLGVTLASAGAVHAGESDLEFCASCRAGYRIGNWAVRQEWEAGRLREVDDDSQQRRGMVTRVEVRPGDKVGGWTGERAEFAHMRDDGNRPLHVLPTTPREYYAVSVRTAPDWRPPQPGARGAWGTILQLHGPDHLAKPPAVALMAEDRFRLNLFTGDVARPGQRVLAYEFSDGTLKPGQWTDFLIEVGWSASPDGAIAVYRRDEGQREWTEVLYRRGIATLQYQGDAPVGPHYWKTGYYRSESSMKSVLWLGPVARGRSREVVERAAFARP